MICRYSEWVLQTKRMVSGRSRSMDTMAVEVPPAAGKQVILLLDNAGWHKTKRLNWHHLEPFYLPP